MKKFLKNKKLLFVSAVVGLVVATGAFFAIRPVDASINDGRNCDTVSILYCGAHSVSEIKSKWNGTHKDVKYSKADVTKIYAHFGISQSDLTGLVEGVVMKDGRVIVNGKTVATEATTAGRWYNPPSGSKRISGTDRAYEFSTRHYTSGTGKTAFVKMVNGEFKWAVTKACGNPVRAKAVAKPKPVAACKNLDAVVSNRTRVTFSSQASVSNGAKISGYRYIVKDASGKTVLDTTRSSTSTSNSYARDFTTPGKYTVSLVVKTSLGDKTATACKASFEIKPAPVKPVAVCENLQAIVNDRTSVTFTSQADVSGGATVSAYVYEIKDSNGNVVFETTRQSTSTSDSFTREFTTPGTYTAQVTVKTSLGDRTEAACKASFKIEEEAKKPVAECKVLNVTPISKTEFQLDAEGTVENGATISGYTFVVTNKDGQAVFNEKVETTENSASIKVTQETPGDYTAKVTVHTSEGDRSGNQCEANFTVEEDEEREDVKRCDVTTGKIVRISEEEAQDTERYKAVDDEACQEKPDEPKGGVPPAELPKTGPAALVSAGMGFSSITAAGYYWLQSRRNLLEQLLRK
jgi:hypothetical protein